MNRRLIISIIIVIATWMASTPLWAFPTRWDTHFAYNSVSQISVGRQDVYAVSDGAMFSVNKMDETLTKYDNRFGLHGAQIACIAYDDAREQLLILYEDGKMDVMVNGRMRYISDLYNKRMTASKLCNNITIAGDKAYLSMEFGILLFDLERYEFRDTYYIGKNATEVQVLDVMLYGDSIYAQTAEKNYCAALSDKVVDYHYWHECDTLPVAFDTNKGKKVTDSDGTLWQVAGEKGVYRKQLSGEEAYYLPEGPQSNIPYRLTTDRGRLYMVQGGRWATQNERAGHVMIYADGHWTNITGAAIQAQTGKQALDFMNVAVDLEDADHFFVTSYGTGLYEFRGTKVVNHYTPANSLLRAAAPNNPDYYTRLDCATYDVEGRLWVTVAGVTDTLLVAFLPEGGQRGLALYDDAHNLRPVHTPGGLLIDDKHHRKWILAARSGTSLSLIDDGGTPLDSRDDKSVIRTKFIDQDHQQIVPEYLYTMAQADNGDIWLGSNIGPIIIEHDADFLTSAACRRLRIEMSDGTNLLESEQVNAFAFDQKKRIWIGTQTSGVYVLDDAATQIIAHYKSDKTPMPSDAVVSLAYDPMHNVMYIGTGAGLVSCQPDVDTTTAVIDTSEDKWTYGTMRQWRAHFAYSSIDEVAVMGDDVYALSGGSLFSVNKQSEETSYHNKLTGLSSSGISHISSNPTLGNLLIMYEDGYWDIMNRRGEISTISDMFLKPISGSKEVNDVVMIGNNAYLAMTFGIVVLDMARKEVKDTYYIGYEASEVDVAYMTAVGDTIFACTNTTLYFADINDNLADYIHWKELLMPSGKNLQGMRRMGNTVCVLKDDSLLYSLENKRWVKHSLDVPLYKLCEMDDKLYGLPQAQSPVREIQADFRLSPFVDYGFTCDLAKDGNTYWLGTRAHGLVRINDAGAQEFRPDGPLSNISYRLQCFGDRLYVLPGGRWASQYNRAGIIMYYENGNWTNIANGELTAVAGKPLMDFMNVAQDPNDKEHYFITTYGTGMIEMRGRQLVKQYLPSNSALASAAPNAPDVYTRTDFAMYDDKSNLWVLNTECSHNVHVISPDGQWSSFNLYPDDSRMQLYTPGGMIIDSRNATWKWIAVSRVNTGIILLQDNGTPTDPSDDKAFFRNEWYDQQGKRVAPSTIYSLAQDNDGAIWVGTNEGVFCIPASVDFATSNRCEQVIIPRNDGSQLGDYLLDKEQINCIVVDGNNRKWIGTATSGVYLLDIQKSIENSGWDVETVAHFTTANSLLPSDNVLSISIQESTGEVFMGTGAGLVSYMSDAVEPAENFDNLYAYPNPVRPTYKGYITIKGIMEDSEVRITDASGNLVKLIRGNGGEVVWDGTNTVGKRVASGIYTAICNTTDGQGHGTVKILIMN